MKKKLFVIGLMTVMLFSACGKIQSEEPVAEENREEIANPWTESDCQGVLEATGIELLPPEGATDICYQYMEAEKMAEVSYELDGAQWVYRAQPAAELLEISGMNYDWDAVDDATVAERTAKYYVHVSEDVADIMVVDWYDAVPGITYSLSASAQELNGMDIQVYAENIFVPCQGED